MKNITYAHRVVQRRKHRSTRQKYLKALIRAYELSVSIKQLRRHTLMKKVFLSFEKKKEFVALKSQIKNICLDKYEVNLLVKCFD